MPNTWAELARVARLSWGEGRLVLFGLGGDLSAANDRGLPDAGHQGGLDDLADGHPVGVSRFQAGIELGLADDRSVGPVGDLIGRRPNRVSTSSMRRGRSRRVTS